MLYCSAGLHKLDWTRFFIDLNLYTAVLFLLTIMLSVLLRYMDINMHIALPRNEQQFVGSGRWCLLASQHFPNLSTISSYSWWQTQHQSIFSSFICMIFCSYTCSCHLKYFTFNFKQYPFI